MISSAILRRAGGAIFSPSAAAYDPHWNSVILLLPFDGGDGATSADDESPFNRFVDFHGNAQLDTVEKKYGTASCYFDGNGDALAITNSPDFNFGTEDFTVEAWVRWSGGQDSYIITNRTGGTNGFGFRINANGSLIAFSVGGQSVSTAAGALATNMWVFVAASRNSGTCRIFLNGVQAATGTLTSVSSSTSLMGIGGAFNDGSGYRYMKGWIDDLRITKGVGRYTADFDPPSAALPVVADAVSSASVMSGAWTWFNDQRAIVTSTGQLVIGGVGSDGTLKIATAPSIVGPYTVAAISNAVNPDDHDNPSFVERSLDSKIVAAYARHNDSSYWVRVSASASDASSMGAAKNIASEIGGSRYSYSNLHDIAGDGVYNFFRRGSTPTWTTHVAKSTDGGVTWSPAQPLIGSGGRPYFKSRKTSPSRIDIVVTDGHPDSVADNSLYHCYFENGNYYDSYGVAIGPLPLSLSNMTKLYDGSAATGRGWVWDVASDANGRPVVAFAVFPSTTDHRYRYATFDGNAWSHQEITPAGGYLYSAEPYYSGGLSLDPDNPTTVYASLGAGGSWSLSRFTTSDSGASWSRADIGVSGNVIRPYKIEGSNALAFVRGRYTSYTNYATTLRIIDVSQI